MKIVRQATQPVPLTDQIYNWNGDLYWQGICLSCGAGSGNRQPYVFGRNGPIVTNQWLRIVDGLPSNTTGIVVPLAGNIIAVAAAMSAAATCTIEVRKKGGGAPLVSLPFVAQLKNKVDVSIPVVSLDELQVYVNGGPARHPSVVVLVA